MITYPKEGTTVRGFVAALLVASMALLLGGCARRQTYPPTTSSSEPTEVRGIAFEDINMVTKYHGWAIASGGVFRTSDGGVNWRAVTPPGVRNVNRSSADWFFLNATTAWLLVNEEHAVESRGVLFSTTDGGRHWSRSEVPFTSARLFIAGYEEQAMGWALKRYGPALGSEPVDLYRMERSGAWNLVHRGEGPFTPTAARDSLPFGGLKKSVGFLPDGKTGWVTIECRGPDQLGFYVTTDGGKTWRVPRLPVPPGLEGSLIDVFPPRFFVDGQANHGVLPVVFHLVREGSQYDSFAAVFFVTEDSGATWKSGPTLWAKGLKPLMAVADPANWWVLADSLSESKLYATRDAGATWVEMGDLRRAFQIQFVTPVDGWALSEDNGDSVLLRTTDGGKNWFQVPAKRRTASLPQGRSPDGPF